MPLVSKLIACLVILILPVVGFTAEKGDRYLIKFRPTVAASSAKNHLSSLGMEVQKHFSEIDVYSVRLEDVSRFKESIEGMSDQIAYIERDAQVRALAVPNDELWRTQVNLARAQLESAWDLATGSASIVIGVSDSGVALDHPDLKNRIWTNPREVPGNGVDDDGNGYVDDVHGWDMVGNDPDPNDENKHGTHVAGIIGAEANNGIGISGVNWDVRIMPVRFLDRSGSGSNSGGVETILYAANNGARVLNCSWGGSEFSQAIEDAIKYAYSKGTLVIAAAGNDGQDSDYRPLYPAAYAHAGVLSVASSDRVGGLSNFSNYGRFSVDVVAPGSQILSSVLNGGYARLSGTSMASPVVSGIAGLILSRRPNLGVQELRNALINAVYQRVGYVGRISSEGDINARKAVQQLDQGFQVWPSRLNLKKGDQYGLTAFGGVGAVQWSVSPSGAAVVNASGVITANEVGEVEVRASDASGALSTVARISIAEGPASPPVGGCSALTNPVRLTGSDEASALASWSLPFLVGFVATRRRRRRKDLRS